MIKTNSKSTNVLEKLKEIERLCIDMKIDFDNTIPNKYKLTYLGVEHIFTTYNDVLYALHLAQMLYKRIRNNKEVK